MGRFDLSPTEITEGSISRALLVLAAPLFVQNMVRVAQQVIDLFWVGRYSKDAVAAIGLASPVVWFLMASTISATFVGTQVLVSQRVGAENYSGARSAAFTGILSTIVMGVGIGVLMFLNVETLLELVTSTRPNASGSAELTRLATRYLEVIALGIVFAGLSDVIEAAFLGWGESRAALYMNVVSVVVNVGLDPLFIFGAGPIPGMGIRGAALATVAGYSAGFLLGVAFVARGRAGGIFSWATARLDADEFRELLDIGLPKAVQGAAGSSGGIVMVLIVFAVAGAPGLAAYTVGSRVGSLSFRSVSSLSQAAQSIVGQNLGAGNLDRATQTTWTGVKLGTALLTVVGAVQWLFPDSSRTCSSPRWRANRSSSRSRTSRFSRSAIQRTASSRWSRPDSTVPAGRRRRWSPRSLRRGSCNCRLRASSESASVSAWKPCSGHARSRPWLGPSASGGTTSTRRTTGCTPAPRNESIATRATDCWRSTIL